MVRIRVRVRVRVRARVRVRVRIRVRVRVSVSVRVRVRLILTLTWWPKWAKPQPADLRLRPRSHASTSPVHEAVSSPPSPSPKSSAVCTAFALSKATKVCRHWLG